jgi:hypothetical protein
LGIRKKVTALVAASCALAGLPSTSLEAQGTPTPIGAWFGIARPCTPGNSRFPNPPGTVDQAVCHEACQGGTCLPSNFPVNEVTMIPTLLADGTVLADDFAELLDFHSTAHGKWEYAGKAVINGRELDKYQATFIWFQARNPDEVDPNNPLSIFEGVVRPRFVTYFDPTNPDTMKGFIQPYIYTMTDKFGIVDLVPGTPFPTVDPVLPLPVECNSIAPVANPRCLGTLTFVIRRIQPR